MQDIVSAMYFTTFVVLMLQNNATSGAMVALNEWQNLDRLMNTLEEDASTNFSVLSGSLGTTCITIYSAAQMPLAGIGFKSNG